MNTSRERFLKTLNFNKPDRVPYFEEGIRDDVIKAWHKQGLPQNKKPSDIFPTDRFTEVVLNFEPNPPLKKWPISKSEIDRLRESLNPSVPSRLPKDWAKKLKHWKKHDQVLMLRVHRGFFLSMGVNDWNRFEEVIYLIKDNPELVQELLQIQSQFSVDIIRMVLEEIQIDAVTFTEPVGGNEGPLFSPQFYGEVVLPTYQPIFDILKKRSIEFFIFKTYANSRQLIPQIEKFDFNCLWACEVNASAMDYMDIRKEFGKELRLIGGIDLDVLRQGKNEIRKEMETKVPELICQGGYIPLADGRMRKEISYENYVYYRKLLKELTTGS